MRPQYNRPQRPQQQQQQRQQQQPQQQNNGYPNQQQNGYHQNPVNQLGMMNPQMMGNPMMGHMNNMQNMPPIHPQFFNNMPHQFGIPNHHINQLLPNLLGSLQFAAAANNNLMGGGHSMPPNFYQPSLDPSAFASQSQLNSFIPRPYPPPPRPLYQNHPSRPPGFPEPRPQVQSVGNVNNTNGPNSKGNQQKFQGPGQGSQSYQGGNANKKYGSNKDRKGKGKGNCNKKATRLDGSDAGDVAKETKRPYIPNYPPKEIQQWRQARRKNFPTKLNVEKKVKKNDSNCSLDDDAKQRRQQLRDVLAKQRELGVEVAEVPSHYLSNPDEQVNGDNRSGQFQNKNGKRGRFGHNKRGGRGGKGKFNKRRKFQDQDSTEESSITTREPTLLEKLLSADIKRDKIQLLQVFRFMVLNSFFSESPEAPLKFPVVMVEETGCEHVEEVLSDDDDVDADGDDNSCDEEGDDDNSCDEASD